MHRGLSPGHWGLYRPLSPGDRGLYRGLSEKDKGLPPFATPELKRTLLPKWLPKRPPRRPISVPERVPLSDVVLEPRGLDFGIGFGPFWDSFSVQTRSRRGSAPRNGDFQKNFRNPLDFYHFLGRPGFIWDKILVPEGSLEGSFSGSRFGVRFWSLFVPKIGPKVDPRAAPEGAQDGPKRVATAPRWGPKSCARPQTAPADGGGGD